MSNKAANKKSLTNLQYFVNSLCEAGYSVHEIATHSGVSELILKRLLSGNTRTCRSPAFIDIFSFYCKVFYAKHLPGSTHNTVFVSESPPKK